jgi:hypothetical protein
MSGIRIVLSITTIVLLSVTADGASAQLYQNRIQAPRARNYIAPPAARRAPSFDRQAGFNRQPISKPFKHVQRQPTVSPYLNLVRDDSGAAANYQTLVRPQMEQIDINRQQEMQFDRLDRQFQDFRSESAYPQQGSLDIRETGHITRFMNRSHYYPE